MKIHTNPVLLKELRLTPRSWRFAGMMFFYTMALSAIAMFLFYTFLQELRYSGGGYQGFIYLYLVIAIIEFSLILFIVPAITAGSIAGERERQTLDILLSTKLKSHQIIIGKLLASLSTVLLLIVASVPVLALVFLFGGVGFLQMLGMIGFYILTAIFTGSISIYVSTAFKKTTVATVVTYAIGIFLILGTLFFTYVYMYFRYRTTGAPKVDDMMFPLLYLNPFVGFFCIVMDQLGNFGILPGPWFSDTEHVRNIWLIHGGIQLITSALCIWRASVRLNPVKKIKIKKVKNAS